MARRRRQPQADERHTSPPRLTVSRHQFERELDERIASGREIRERAIGSHEELKAAEADYYVWNDYNVTLLRQRFMTTEIADDYASGPGIAFIPMGPPSFSEEPRGPSPGP